MKKDLSRYEVKADTYYNTLSHSHPVLARVLPGDTIFTRLLDTGGRDENDVSRAKPGNPLTGPIYVEGAEPGDALRVHLLKLTLNRTRGASYYRLGLFSLTPESIENLYPNRYKEDLVYAKLANIVPWEIDIKGGTVRLKEPVSETMGLEFPVRPMLGCIGVAPAGDFAPPTYPAGSYGGNLDYNKIGEGAVVILPVYHPGGLLFLGDGHALQGDGEPLGSGIETSMDAEFTVDVWRNANLTGPRVETKDDIISIGSQAEFASSLDRALQMATTDMVDWLVRGYKLEPWAAHLLIGCQARYDVLTVAGSMALRTPRKYLPGQS